MYQLYVLIVCARCVYYLVCTSCMYSLYVLIMYLIVVCMFYIVLHTRSMN